MKNPLLQAFDTPFGVPPFNKISNEYYLPAINEAIEIARKEVDEIIKEPQPPSFGNTILALEHVGELLGRITSILFNLNSAETSPEIQKTTQEASPLLTGFNNEIKQNVKLFMRIKGVYEKRNELRLTAEERMLLDKTYKSYIRSGASLDGEKKRRFGEIAVELSTLGLKFGENILAETNDFILKVTDEKELAGIPQDVIVRAKIEAGKRGLKDTWVFTLHMPSYMPLLEYADNRELREKMFRAFSSKCFKGNKNDNQELVRRIVKLRHELAHLLGYTSYAQFILEERMAKSPEQVLDFLTEFLGKAKGKAEAEVEEIKEFMSEMGADHDLQRWDWSYFSEKLRKKKYDLDDEMIKPYFKLENVIDGVFETAHRLYEITFRPSKELPVYHQDVTSYEVLDSSGEVIAIFLADYFPRPGKRDGAWMTSYRDQKKSEGVRVIPIISIVCNFTPSSENNPSLLKFNEVLTLFHEFGHALHGMLADTTFESLSGTSVYWDFVELPSQIMENWCYEKECLDLFARHYQTNEPIPQEYIERIRKSATYHEAYATLRQISFGLLDMAYHGQSTEIEDVGQLESETMKETDLFSVVSGANMSVQFSHIFAGGYAAGYYSYKWAEVLDADAFSMFKERGVFDKETAKSFKENILSKGGTEPPMELYKKFRGKEPSVDALLERAGLV